MINRTITMKQKWGEKQSSGYFKGQTNEISNGETWIWLEMGNFKRKTESLLIAAQNSARRINYNKMKIDQMQPKFWLWGDWYETIDHTINESSKLVQKEYKARHNWVGKMIYWELCKIFKIEHTNKRYMQKLESILENGMLKILWEFKIKTDHLIPARRSHLVIVNNKREPAK